MNQIIFVLVLMVGITTTAGSLASLLSSLSSDPLTALCNGLSANPTAATNILTTWENALAQGNVAQNFPLSVNYIKTQSSQLLASVPSCVSFFNGLQAQFQIDLQNDKQSVANIRQQLIQFVESQIGAIPTPTPPSG